MKQKLLALLCILIHKAAQVGRITPFFLGVLYVHLPQSTLFFHLYFERYLYFLAIFGIWTVLLLSVIKFYQPLRNKERKVPQLKVALIIFGLLVLALSSLTILTYVRERFPFEVFSLVLALLGIFSISEVLLSKKKYLLGLCLSFFVIFGVGYASFVIATYDWIWPPLLVSAALACILTAQRVAEALSLGSIQDKKLRDALLRIIQVLLFLGPVLLSVLVYLGYLKRPYLIILLLILPLTMRVFQRFKAEALPKHFLNSIELICLLYIVIQIGLKIV